MKKINSTKIVYLFLTLLSYISIQSAEKTQCETENRPPESTVSPNHYAQVDKNTRDAFDLNIIRKQAQYQNNKPQNKLEYYNNNYYQNNNSSQYNNNSSQYNNNSSQYNNNSSQYSNDNQHNNNNLYYNNGVITKNTEGVFDTSFGDGKGYVINAISPTGTNSQARAVATTQPNNSIVVVGTRENRAVLVKYNNASSLDTKFGGIGGNGIVITNMGSTPNSISFFNTIAIDKDKSIIAAGQSNGYLALARYYENGTLDTLFGDKGIVTSTQTREITAIALQKDTIIATGYNAGENIVLVRFDKRGKLDTTFGEQSGLQEPGIVITEIGSSAVGNAIAIQKNNKIVVVGSGSKTQKYQTAIVRYTKNGKLDTTFGLDHTGIVAITIGNFGSSAYGVAIQEDNKIVVVGQSYHLDGAPVFTTIRLHENGTLDTSFGRNGTGVVTIRPEGAPYPAYARSVAITEDQKIIVMGYVNVDNRNNFTILRYDEHGMLDTTFGVQGIQSNTLNVNLVPNHTALPVVGTLQDDNEKIVLAGNYAPTLTPINNQFAVARYVNKFS